MERPNPGAPYIARELDDSLRLEWIRARLLDPQGPIRRLSVVGGIVNRRNELFTPDRTHLTLIVRELRNKGYALAPHFGISWYNLLPPMQNDFLMAALGKYSNTPNTEALIILGLPRYGEAGWLKNPRLYDENIDRHVREDYENTGNMTVVSRLTRPDIWPDAAWESGPRVIATWGGREDELSSDTFRQDRRKRYKVLKATAAHASLQSMGIDGVGIIERIPGPNAL